MQVGVNPLNSEIFFKKLRKPLDDRFLLFRAVAAAKAGDGRQDLVNIRAGRFERTVAERIGDEALRLRGLQLFFCDDLLQLLLLLLLHTARLSYRFSPVHKCHRSVLQLHLQLPDHLSGMPVSSP